MPPTASERAAASAPPDPSMPITTAAGAAARAAASGAGGGDAAGRAKRLVLRTSRAAERAVPDAELAEVATEAAGEAGDQDPGAAVAGETPAVTTDQALATPPEAAPAAPRPRMRLKPIADPATPVAAPPAAAGGAG